MILEEQLCDWTDMASAFFRGHGKGRIHMSVYLQPATVKERTFFNLLSKHMDKKVCVHQIHIYFQTQGQIPR